MLFGVSLDEDRGPEIVVADNVADAARARLAIQQGRSVIAVQPSKEFLRAFDLEAQLLPARPPTVLGNLQARGKSRVRLRTLHETWCFRGPSHADIPPIVLSEGGDDVWGGIDVEASVRLFIGKNLWKYVMQYRQGDPCSDPNDSDG